VGPKNASRSTLSKQRSTNPGKSANGREEARKVSCRAVCSALVFVLLELDIGRVPTGTLLIAE
jgi:hypothetical protein